VTELLLSVAIVASLACPLHMLWHSRRHRGPAPADDVRARQRAVTEELARRTSAGREAHDRPSLQA
jgi:hypothetical protein